MARRQKNLLEAFQASGVDKHTPKLPGLTPPSPPAPTPTPPPTPPAPPGAKAPKTKAKPPQPAKPEPPQPARRAEPVIPRRSRIDVDPRRLAILGGVLVVLALVFLSGRWTAEDVEAGEAATGLDANAMLEREAQAWAALDAADGDTASAAQAGAAGVGDPGYYTEDDRAFHDPRNRFTVRVIAFRKDTRGEALAWECYAYLRELQLPAISPIGQGGSIMLYVGAGSDLEEMQRLADRIAELRGPPPQSRPGEFRDAYPVNISEQIERGDS